MKITRQKSKNACTCFQFLWHLSNVKHLLVFFVNVLVSRLIGDVHHISFLYSSWQKQNDNTYLGLYEIYQTKIENLFQPISKEKQRPNVVTTNVLI